MTRWNVNYFFILAGTFLAMGCSDASPTVAYLKSIDKFEFTNSNVATADLTAVPLIASCTSFMDRIDVSFDNGTTWTASNTYDTHSSNSCSGGKYQVTITNQSTPLSAMTITSGQTFTVKFRGFSKAGYYVYRSVNIKYTPSATIQQAILAGAGPATGTGYKFKGRALAQEQNTATGTGLILKGRVTQ